MKRRSKLLSDDIVLDHRRSIVERTTARRSSVRRASLARLSSGHASNTTSANGLSCVAGNHADGKRTYLYPWLFRKRAARLFSVR